MSTRFEVTEPTPRVEGTPSIGIEGEAVACGGEPLRESALYGQADCPYGWVCVSEHHGHDASPIALIDVYSLPEEAEQ